MVMNCFDVTNNKLDDSNMDISDELFSQVKRCDFGIQAYRDTQPDMVNVYSFVSKKLYQQLLNSVRVVPVFGTSCKLVSDGAYLALDKRFGSKFFGWADKFWLDVKDTKTGELLYNEVGEASTDIILLELEVPKEYVMFTNFRNWTDMEVIYGDISRDPTEQELKEILDLEFNGLNKTLEELWNDVFYLEKGEHVQIMLSELRIEWVRNVRYYNRGVIAY